MWKRRRPNAGPIGARVAVADEVVPVVPLGRLDREKGLARGNDRPPAHTQKVGDEGLDVVHGPLLERRRGESMERLVGTGRHVVGALLDDAQALPHLLDPNDRAVVAITVLGGWNVELEL